MATTRPFAYNIGSPFSGATQVGNLAIGIPDIGFESTGLEWWNGPDEELGYVIAVPVSNDSQPTNVDYDFYLDPSHKGSNITLTGSNQTANQANGYQQSVLGLSQINEGDKVMFSVLVELTAVHPTQTDHVIGIGYQTMNYEGPGGYPGGDNDGIGYCSNGNIYGNSGTYFASASPWTDGDIIDIVINTQTSGMSVRVNGGDWDNDPSHDPANNPNMMGVEIFQGPFYPVLCPEEGGSMTIQNTSTYPVPTGYKFLGDITASVGFFRTDNIDETEFINLVKVVTGYQASSGADAKTWLNSNGYWTSYSDMATPVLSLDAANYTSGDWIDSIGGKSFVLYNSPTWSSSNGGYFNFNTSLSQSIKCSTSLPSLGTWSVAVWHYYDGTNTGSYPCIVTETFVGGSLNYTLGNSTGSGLSSGFFNGGWQISGGYSLTPNNWYYIVGTYDGTTNKLYVNNTLVVSNNYTWSPTTSGAGIRLMERWDSADYWGGRLATVDIYDKALSDSEIESIWNLTKSRFGL